MTLDQLLDLEARSHVCWLVDDRVTYVEAATRLLCDAQRAGEKPLLIGPAGGNATGEWAPLGMAVVDPLVDFLDGGPLIADAMFAAFDRELARARFEGFAGLRVVADMDWVLPLRPSMDEIVAFELLLDRHVHDLDLTVVCAYRQDSFDTELLAGALCVHPADAGADESPQFRLVAAGQRVWRLTGELDLAVTANFEAALVGATGPSGCVVDVSGLDFIDVASMRVIARAGQTSGSPIRLVGTPPVFRRSWELAGFGALAPTVELVG